MGASASGPVVIPEELRQLADAYGVATEYWDQAGGHVQVEAATIEAVLRALGIDFERPDAVAYALRAVRERDWRRMLPPVFITRQGEQRRAWVHVPHGAPASAWIQTEDGRRIDLRQMDHWVDPVEIDGSLVGEASFAVPGDLPLGWHELIAESNGTVARCPLAMTPARLHPADIAGGRQWGFMCQLYALRSAKSWAMGDLHDLADLSAWSAERLAAGFVLINPLHAPSPVAPIAPSPYLPVTRRFVSPLYLRVEDIPEFHALPAQRQAAIEVAAAPLRAADRTADLLDRDAMWRIKRPALEEVFAAGRSAEREAAFRAFCAELGPGLVDFATWCAIADEHGPNAASWPASLARPDLPTTAAYRDQHRSAVNFHMWLQWMVDEQLRAAQRAAQDAGMPIGIMHDLAVGVHPEGADAWALQDVLARGASVGAPPDMYNQMGQNWDQPPWRPDALADVAFAPYRDMLRTVLRHAGGLRIDHVLGLFRLWWVPQGFPASAGTFVRYDHEAMLGILALEAHRAGAIVVGEDLGTVEPWVQDALADRGILGTVILWFERDGQALLAPERWRGEVLASVTVHDLPPTAGYLQDEHVRIRSELGLLARPVEDERADAARERAAWLGLAAERGWLASADLATAAGLDAAVVALHRALAASPARLLGVGLPDAAGDRRAQNQPGTDQEYPNWRVPMTDGSGRAVLLEDLVHGTPLLQAIVQAVSPPDPTHW